MTIQDCSPTPWITDPEDGHQFVLDANGQRIAACAGYGPGKTLRKSRANARLIAAAPDMYAALERVLSQYDGGGRLPSDHPLEMSRAALAKARGE